VQAGPVTQWVFWNAEEGAEEDEEEDAEVGLGHRPGGHQEQDMVAGEAENAPEDALEDADSSAASS